MNPGRQRDEACDRRPRSSAVVLVLLLTFTASTLLPGCAGAGRNADAIITKRFDLVSDAGVARFAHGGGGVALHGAESRGAAVLFLKDGAGSLTFYDESGETRQRVPDPGASTPEDDDR